MINILENCLARPSWTAENRHNPNAESRHTTLANADKDIHYRELPVFEFSLIRHAREREGLENLGRATQGVFVLQAQSFIFNGSFDGLRLVMVTVKMSWKDAGPRVEGWNDGGVKRGKRKRGFVLAVSGKDPGEPRGPRVLRDAALVTLSHQSPPFPLRPRRPRRTPRRPKHFSRGNI